MAGGSGSAAAPPAAAAASSSSSSSAAQVARRPSAASSAGGASAGSEAPPVVRVWERLFANGGLAQYISPGEVRHCRRVCRDWRRYAGAGACEEELWNAELGSARRAAAWKQLLLGGITLKQRAGTHQDNYERLCEMESQYDSAIRRDVNRTLPQEELFKERNGTGQQALFRLLRALSIRLLDIGYCQSLNFIVATLIGVFPDDEAAVFQCALALLLRHSLVDLYRPKFLKLGVVVWQFDKIVEGFLPKVHAALVRHGVNSEYYAIQWFLTLFASDLQQPTVRRVWDRFLVAGWRVVVQVGLALLYTVQDVLPTMETCHALSFLKKFAKTVSYSAEELLRHAATFKVSHRMLSALEAAYNWEDEVQLLVIKDLNSGQVHWAVQAVAAPPPSSGSRRDGGETDTEEPGVDIPRAFTRNGPPSTSGALDGMEGEASGTVLPFLLHNLDTGEQTVIDEAWSQYTDDMGRRSRATAGPLQARPTSGPGMPALSPEALMEGPLVQSCRSGGESGTSSQQTGGGSFWMQSVQRQAVRRLGQV